MPKAAQASVWVEMASPSAKSNKTAVSSWRLAASSLVVKISGQAVSNMEFAVPSE
jgi:hypothetical protein